MIRWEFSLLLAAVTLGAPAFAQSDQAPIVRAVIGLGRSLGLRTLAEGIESEEQIAFLAAEGCDECQGYYFGRPVPADELPDLVNGRI